MSDDLDTPYALDFDKAKATGPSAGGVIQLVVGLCHDVTSRLNRGGTTTEGEIVSVMALINYASDFTDMAEYAADYESAVILAARGGQIIGDSWGYLLGKTPTEALEAHEDVHYSTAEFTEQDGRDVDVHVLVDQASNFTVVDRSLRYAVMAEYGGRTEAPEDMPIK